MSKIQEVALNGIFEKLISVQKQVSKKYTEMVDEELIVAVQDGDQIAYQHIVTRFQGKIFAYIMRLINHSEEAKDITQIVFLKAFRNLHTFDTERKFSSWLYRIAHNESVNWLKKKTRVKIESLEEKVEQGQQFAQNIDIHQVLIAKEQCESVRLAIADLPVKYRKIMYLRYLEQKSYQEISRLLKKPVNTIGTIINRAKQKMRQSLC